jgi:hypothetical protein
MRYYGESGFQGEGTTYKIRITDVLYRVTELPVSSLEEFTALVAALGPEKVVLNSRDNSIDLIPRLIVA